MITILLPFYNLGLGGVQTKIIDLANTLVKSNSYKVIIYLEKKEAFDRADELDSRVKIIYCPQFFSFAVKRRYYYALLLLIYFYRPLSIFVSLEKTSVFVLWAKTHVPFFPSKVVVNVDTYLKNEQKYPDSVITQLYQNATAVLAPSLAARNDFLERLKLSSPPVRYLPNWVDVKNSTLPGTEKTRELLYAGRLEPQKDPLLYLKFMRHLQQKESAAELAIFGHGTLENELKKQVKKYGLEQAIHFYPTTHHMSDQLRKTRFLVLLSKYEGMPLIGLEAMKYGCVILGKDVAGIQDIIQDGVTGICKRTVSEIVAEYLKIKNNPTQYQAMRDAAFAYLKANFDQRRRTEIISILTQTPA